MPRTRRQTVSPRSKRETAKRVTAVAQSLRSQTSANDTQETADISLVNPSEDIKPQLSRPTSPISIKHTCDDCGKTFAHSASLRTHRLSAHENSMMLRQSLGDVIQWENEGQSHLLTQQVIYSEGPEVLDVIDTSFEKFTVPAKSTQLSKAELQLKMDADSNHVLREEPKTVQLHTDSNATNVFQLVQHSPSTSQTLEETHNSKTYPWAVQLLNRIFPLTKPCWILIPRDIPYAFINETSKDVILWRVICSHEPLPA